MLDALRLFVILVLGLPLTLFPTLDHVLSSLSYFEVFFLGGLACIWFVELPSRHEPPHLLRLSKEILAHFLDTSGQDLIKTDGIKLRLSEDLNFYDDCD